MTCYELDGGIFEVKDHEIRNASYCNQNKPKIMKRELTEHLQDVHKQNLKAAILQYSEKNIKKSNSTLIHPNWGEKIIISLLATVTCLTKIY